MSENEEDTLAQLRYQRDELLDRWNRIALIPGVERYVEALDWLRQRIAPGGQAWRLLRGVESRATSAVVPNPFVGDLDEDLARFSATHRDKVVVIVSGLRLVEAEGQRPTRMALDLARRGYGVIHVFWRWHPRHLWVQDRLEEGILQIPSDIFLERWAGILDRVAAPERRVLCTFPHRAFEGALAAARTAGWRLTYDLLDDWGAFAAAGRIAWYDEEYETRLLREADVVVAVSERLAHRARARCGREVAVVPNGLRIGIDRVDRPRPLPRGEVTLGYFGHFASAWFDWELLDGVARARPDWKIYVIGYGGSGYKRMPSNVVHLGRVSQSQLASYAQSWDVATIPFRETEITASCDPIKLYEYLAMGLPVVVTGMDVHAFAPWAERARGVSDFVERAARLARRDDALVAQAGRSLAMENSWQRRVDDLLRLENQ